MEDSQPDNPLAAPGKPWLAICALALAVVAPCTLFFTAPVALVLATIAFMRRSGIYVAVAAGLGGLIGTLLLVLMVQGGPIRIARTLGTDDSARTAELWIDAVYLISNLESYRKISERLPQSLDELGWGDAAPKAWGQDIRIDPWGRTYRIARRDVDGTEKALIVSDGPDGVSETADDILLVDLEKLEPLVKEP